MVLSHPGVGQVQLIFHKRYRCGLFAGVHVHRLDGGKRSVELAALTAHMAGRGCCTPGMRCRPPGRGGVALGTFPWSLVVPGRLATGSAFHRASGATAAVVRWHNPQAQDIHPKNCVFLCYNMRIECKQMV
jgi:hypothetical protein